MLGTYTKKNIFKNWAQKPKALAGKSENTIWQNGHKSKNGHYGLNIRTSPVSIERYGKM